ncbi:MAG: sugar transferase [Neisseriaceae bacterium]
MEGFQPTSGYRFFKRYLDVALILLSLPVSIPLFVLITIIIRLESRGPAIFMQKRVGYLGKEFKIYKFRSMYMHAERGGAQFAEINDQRVTPFGKILRKLRLDELPQFFNVLKGEMSLIGPRPEQKIFVEKFEKEIPYYSCRHNVLPGISGLAQVKQGYVSSSRETAIKLEYDLYYLKHFSFMLDLKIFFLTFKTIFTGFGAR